MVIDIYHLILLKQGYYSLEYWALFDEQICPCSFLIKQGHIKYINIVLLIKLRYGLLFNKQNYLYIDQQHGPKYMYCMPFLAHSYVPVYIVMLQERITLVNSHFIFLYICSINLIIK
jgi:hypothetical protein